MNLQKFIDSPPSNVVIYDPTDIDSILLRKTEEIDDLEPWEKIIPIMFDIMRKHRGCGLAAPQIGLSYKAFILNVTKPMVFINPKIIEYGKDLKTEEEGCLSLPGQNYQITRSIKIKVEWTRLEDGKHQIQQYEGWTSRAFQHEYDHLLGKLICQN